MTKGNCKCKYNLQILGFINETQTKQYLFIKQLISKLSIQGPIYLKIMNHLHRNSFRLCFTNEAHNVVY